MRGQVGYWSWEGVAVGLDRELVAWLDGRRGLIEVLPHRRVRVTAGDAGVVATRKSRHSFEWFLTPTDENPVRCELARFGLTDVEFRYVSDDAVECELPDDHELEWPRLRECAHYLADVVAEEVLTARLCSIVAGGQSSLSPKQRPPDAFRRLLPQGAWQRAAAAARALSGVC